jgi:hypothetical protein
MMSINIRKVRGELLRATEKIDYEFLGINNSPFQGKCGASGAKYSCCQFFIDNA